jgi:hypothetical protein
LRDSVARDAIRIFTITANLAFPFIIHMIVLFASCAGCTICTNLAVWITAIYQALQVLGPTISVLALHAFCSIRNTVALNASFTAAFILGPNNGEKATTEGNRA